MKRNWKKAICAVATAGLALQPLTAHTEDIDLFVGNNSDTTRPNILIVLDNTSNWSRQSQQWPGGLAQGQSEVRAIKNALAGIATGSVNVGLMEFVTEGNANDDGGYIRHAVKLLDETNYDLFSDKLDTIFDGIGTPIEKRNSNTAYGNLVYDVYNYLAGIDVYNGGAGTPNLRDADGYTAVHSRFRSPLTEETICGNTYVIYITNPNSSGPATDSSANSTTLKNLIAGVSGTAAKLAGDSSGTPLPLPNFSTSSTTTTQSFGLTSQCYNRNNATCTDIGANATDASLITQCTAYGTCICAASSTSCGGSNRKFEITGENTVFTVTPTNTFNNVIGSAWNFDDWARFLYNYGVPFGSGESATRGKVVTYTIDVFNAHQNGEHTSLMMSAAKVGGGRYFAARNEEAIESALEEIFAEIQAVNSSFASAALPVTATNRSENENQVYVPMFRPSRLQKPRWFGNLKRYQIGYVNGFLSLTDVEGTQASNPQTGFIADCARSWWTSAPGTTAFTDQNGAALYNYWDATAHSVTLDDDLASKCLNVAYPYSDSPDGPFVEKGGVSEQLRKGNNGLENRTIKTRSGNTLVDFTDTVDLGLASGLDNADVVNFIRGRDVDNAEGNKTAESEARVGIHGDVVHSRPLPVNYGGDTGVVVYYGGNDGTFRAVDADTGAELWSFVAPEHYSKFSRLYANLPNIRYPNQSDEVAAGNLPKDYFFDGSTSSLLYYDADNEISRAWIFPTMRRGGRMVYGFNVTNPASPALLWAAGCPNMANDTGCSTDMSGIGQTWSLPTVALIKGYGRPLGGGATETAGNSPVLVIGGGYDSCDDDESTTVDGNGAITAVSAACTSSAKGRKVFVLDATTGTVIRSFDTDAPVPADISVTDINSDRRADFAYVADTGGNVYRIDFVTPSTGLPRAPADWTIRKIAYIQVANGSVRKFLYGPTVLNVGDGNYLALGTGNRERPLMVNYPYAVDVQDRFYVFYDHYRSDVAAFNLDDTTYMQAARDATCDTEGVGFGSTKLGWFYDYAARGEQTVTSAVIHLGTVTFSTSQAGPTQSENNMCVPDLGTARSYTLNLLTGSGARNTANGCGGDDFVVMAGGGIPPSPVLATVNVGGKKETVIIGAGSGGIGDVADARPKVAPKVKRKYWSSKIDE
ncbi:hypothetical protein CJ010_13785 [Azoarcus sp. DD4]|uniref:pilus assembly protein n=1 Tax=Azoarcus sp. DD4 TaxID=2027405 RepID=UPI00112B71FB|nr:PilC/PilY family type IV pilus protein [Azoarcus sp. DD4]QDF97529.1 hypothetical protein CJ010_13785 [Azoarcus sp. DD4]